MVLSVPTSAETPRTPSAKRYHRTIPKHLSNNNSNNNNNIIDSLQMSMTQPPTLSERVSPAGTKKASCQCPGVQHVPCSYIGSQHLNQNNHHLFLSTLTTKLNNAVAVKQQQNKQQKIPTISRSDDQQSFAAAQQIVEQQNYEMRRSIKPNLLKLEAAHPNALSILQHQVSANKKIQMSKQNYTEQRTVLANLPPIQPEPVNKTNLAATRHNLLEQQNEQEAMLSVYPSTLDKALLPCLPPKQYKNGGTTKQVAFRSSTSPRCSNESVMIPFSLQNNNVIDDLKCRQNTRPFKTTLTKTLPRTESAHADVDKLIPKYYIQQQYFGNNTLPKNSKQANRGGLSNLTEVVNKVPSVITLPHPSTNKNTLKTPSSSSSDKRVLNSKKLQTCSAGNPQKTEKPLPVLTTSTNCMNPKQHFLPNDTSLDDDYLR